MTTSSIAYIKSLHTRLLYPFFFDKNHLEEAKNSLTQLQFADRPVWQTLTNLHQQEHRQPEKQGVLEDFYHQDLFEPVTQFLFAPDHDATALDAEREEGSQPKKHPANYLKLNPQLANTWFGNGVSVSHKHEHFVAKLTDPGIEVFLSPQGVGVLSIALTGDLKLTTREGDESLPVIDFDTCKQFNYRLSQARRNNVPSLSLLGKVKPDSEGKAETVEDDKLKLPLDQRLGKRAEAFTLLELRRFLLQPLQQQCHLKPLQAQFSVYTVVRLGLDNQDLNFLDDIVASQFLPLLKGLTHVEEEGHVGSTNIHANPFNSHHWAAVGSLGVAHLVLDQVPVHPFNEQRVPTMFKKYFVIHLCVLWQRLILQRTLEEISQAFRHATPELTVSQVQALHGEILQFMAVGYFSEISSRETRNQFYSLCQEGLRVSNTLEIIRRALHDLDMKNNVVLQLELTREVKENVHTVAAVQSKLEWLEIFFVSYYAAALAYYVAGSLEFGHRYKGFGIIGWALFGGIMAALGLRPWQVHGQNQTSAAPSSSIRWFLLGMVITLGLIGIWIGVGLTCFGSGEH